MLKKSAICGHASLSPKKACLNPYIDNNIGEAEILDNLVAL